MIDSVEDNMFVANLTFMAEMTDKLKELKRVINSPLGINRATGKIVNGLPVEILAPELKIRILKYLKNLGVTISVAPGYDIDRTTGQLIPDSTIKVYADGDYIWDSETINLFEKYDLKLSNDFIEHVLTRF